jgi:hypothetical protein
MEWISDINVWTALITLTVLEIILGIDNIVVISILTSKLPLHQQAKRDRSASGWRSSRGFFSCSRLSGWQALQPHMFTIFQQ